MSSKTKEKEPITIETTILKINVKTTGDLITKDYDLLPFHPNMADLRDLSNNSYILFPSFVKITMKDLQKAGLGSDYPKIFMDLDKYIKLIKYVTGAEKEDDDTLLIDKTQVKNYTVSLAQNAMTDLMADTTTDIIAIQKSEPLTEEEIIINNIELIKSLFFPLNGRFFILGNEYVIGQSKYVPPYVASVEINEPLSKDSVKKIPLAYTIKLEVQLLDAVNNPEAGDFMKMSCKAKKANIAKDMKDIFGTNFGYQPEKKVATSSILNTSKETQNRQFGKIQKEWEARNKYIKAPTNDQERREMEAKWTPLQKKMADYDKNQEIYDKIPPLWLTETDALDKKYKDVKIELLGLWKEMANIHESNPGESSFKHDLLDGVKTKINNVFENLSMKKETLAEADRAKADSLASVIAGENNPVKKREILRAKNYSKALEDALLEYDRTKQELEVKKVEFAANPAELKNLDQRYNVELNSSAEKIALLDTVNEFISTLEVHKKTTDETIVQTVIDKSVLLLKSKEAQQLNIDDKYIDSLKADAGLSEKQKDIDAIKKKEAELIAQRSTSDAYDAPSINAEIAKVQAELRKKIADKEVMEKKYKGMVNGWKEAKNKMKSLADSIESEKTKAAKEAKNKTVKEELTKKMDLIKKKEKLYLVATVKEGDEEKTSKSEREKLEKEDRPVDTAQTLKNEITSMKADYLEIAGRRGFFYKIQAELEFLNEQMKRIKEVLLKGAEDDKNGVDKKIKEIDKTIDSIRDRQGQITDQSRYNELKKEQEVIKKEAEPKKFQSKINKFKRKAKLYETYIKILKKIGDNKEAENNFNKEYTTFFGELNTKEQNLEEITKNIDNLPEMKKYIDTLPSSSSSPSSYVKEIGNEYLKLLEDKIVLDSKKPTDSSDQEKKRKEQAAIDEERTKKDKEVENKKNDITENIKNEFAEMRAELNLKGEEKQKVEEQTGGKRTRKHSHKRRPKKTKRSSVTRNKRTLKKLRRLKKYLRKRRRTLRKR